MNAGPAHPPKNPGVPRLGANWILIGFLAVAGFFLFSEHRAHLLGWLPYLLLLACPLMHLFHDHSRHGGHGARPPAGTPAEHVHRDADQPKSGKN